MPGTAPFLFIELNGVSPQQLGLFFGANACGLIGASQLNRRLLRRSGKSPRSFSHACKG